jgi:hypothetical protein
MNKTLVLVIPFALVVSSACSVSKSVAPTAPTLVAASDPEPAPVAPPVQYPTNGPDVIAYVAAKYPEKLAGGISLEERVANMQFLRDRIIEVGKCGGLDLGWNLKRGGPEISNDFITERVGGTVFGHDIGFAYDDPSRPLQLYWGDGSMPFYKEYPQPSC